MTAIVLDITPLYGKIDWPPKEPPRRALPRFRGRPEPVHANLAAKKPPAAPTGETAGAAMGRLAVRHIESEIAKAHVLSVIELAEAFLATFTPRFSRIDDRPRNQPFHLAVS